MAKSYQDRRNKALARRRLLAGVPRCERIVTLPGASAECVRELVRQKSIDGQTEQFWVERMISREHQLRETAALLGAKPTIVIEEVTNWTLPENVDLVNLDLEEGFSPGLGRWLETNSGRLKTDSTLLIWITSRRARNRRINTFQEWLGAHITADPTLLDLREVIEQGVLDQHGIANVTDICMDALVAIRCALRNRRLTMSGIIQYADSKWGMFAVRFEVGGVKEQNQRDAIPPFKSIDEQFGIAYRKLRHRKSSSGKGGDSPEKVKTRRLPATYKDRFIIGQLRDSWVLLDAETRTEIERFPSLAELGSTVSRKMSGMYEAEQKSATMRAAGHKAHATRISKKLALLEVELAGASGYHGIQITTQITALREKFAGHIAAAREAEYQRRGLLAASTRKANKDEVPKAKAPAKPSKTPKIGNASKASKASKTTTLKKKSAIMCEAGRKAYATRIRRLAEKNPGNTRPQTA